MGGKVGAAVRFVYRSRAFVPVPWVLAACAATVVFKDTLGLLAASIAPLEDDNLLGLDLPALSVVALACSNSNIVVAGAFVSFALRITRSLQPDYLRLCKTKGAAPSRLVGVALAAALIHAAIFWACCVLASLGMCVLACRGSFEPDYGSYLLGLNPEDPQLQIASSFGLSAALVFEDGLSCLALAAMEASLYVVGSGIAAPTFALAAVYLLYREGIPALYMLWPGGAGIVRSLSLPWALLFGSRDELADAIGGMQPDFVCIVGFVLVIAASALMAERFPNILKAR